MARSTAKRGPGRPQLFKDTACLSLRLNGSQIRFIGNVALKEGIQRTAAARLVIDAGMYALKRKGH